MAAKKSTKKKVAKRKVSSVKTVKKTVKRGATGRPITVKQRALLNAGKAKQVLHNKKEMLSALESSLGVVHPACVAVGISRPTFYDYYNTDKVFAKDVDDVKEMARDYVESKMFKSIKGDNTTMIIFYLKCQAKARGYVEKETENIDNGQKDIPMVTHIKKVEK